MQDLTPSTKDKVTRALGFVRAAVLDNGPKLQVD